MFGLNARRREDEEILEEADESAARHRELIANFAREERRRQAERDAGITRVLTAAGWDEVEPGTYDSGIKWYAADRPPVRYVRRGTRTQVRLKSRAVLGTERELEPKPEVVAD